VEDALHRLGWLLVDVSSLDAPDAPGAAATLLQGVFAEAARTFALPESDLVELTQQNNERTGCQALSYLPLGSEPLYAEGQAQQVRREKELTCCFFLPAASNLPAASLLVGRLRSSCVQYSLIRSSSI